MRKTIELWYCEVKITLQMVEIYLHLPILKLVQDRFQCLKVGQRSVALVWIRFYPARTRSSPPFRLLRRLKYVNSVPFEIIQAWKHQKDMKWTNFTTLKNTRTVLKAGDEKLKIYYTKENTIQLRANHLMIMIPI